MACSHEQCRRVRQTGERTERRKRVRARLRRTCRHDEFLISARRVAREGVHPSGHRARTDRHRHRGPQQRGGRGAGLCRPRTMERACAQREGNQGHRSAGDKAHRRRTAGLCRWHARHPRLSAKPRRLGPPHAPAYCGQEPRREGRMHSLSRRSHRTHRGAQSHRDAANADQIRRAHRSSEAIKGHQQATRPSRSQYALSR